MMSRFPFTPSFYNLLPAAGFTHIHYKGLQKKTHQDRPLEHDDYILVPCDHDFSLKFDDAAIILRKMAMQNSDSAKIKKLSLNYTKETL